MSDARPSRVSRSVLTLSCISAALGLYIACSNGGGLTSPSSEAAVSRGAETGGVTAQASPVNIRPSPGNNGPSPGTAGPTPGNVGPTPGNVGPTPGNVGPTPGNVGPTPGNVGPTPGNVGPTPGNVGPTPGNIGPTPGNIGPSPGGGGGSSPSPSPSGSGSPSPSPSGSGSPTPTPSPTCASVGEQTFSDTTPFMTSGGGSGPSQTVAGFPNCKITNVTVSLHATSPALTAESGNHFIIALIKEGAVIDNRLIDAFGQGVTLTGTSLGNSCGDGLAFQEGAPTFIDANASPPYASTFSPFGPSSSPDGTFDDFEGMSPNGTWTLAFYQVPSSAAPVTVQCWTLRLTLSN